MEEYFTAYGIQQSFIDAMDNTYIDSLHLTKLKFKAEEMWGTKLEMVVKNFTFSYKEETDFIVEISIQCFNDGLSFHVSVEEENGGWEKSYNQKILPEVKEDVLAVINELKRYLISQNVIASDTQIGYGYHIKTYIF
ncbi:hypothetical protein [Falsibacillus pallidus]|uniref:hypothetical protein n=1 Tax=Falsibacillus pallidus TaxID=493781 RepID=UPI003D987F03